ncbi:hypothetical protein PPL_04233 [Heterostelium album PN500]|uniref:Phospholipase/carboxylesterase/thioesterase domain-containing protein n=1 Tax=Heterostelium pallidum (strain ATCC 26659 / Pp 5 / PN500) TaxID=670386 RepID=D3B702_HETP5|nr:hypothetical protein PPL_04233 [Heterostelium album PN500]EFA82545.1 hypothetical protein PPL_04233 [Heterostelium album PN500]|eukprot:XP_020434662.1 hypothetical protein PPL_04233 [Heterostelium album PN500]
MGNQHIKFILPNAPRQPVSFLQGAVLPSWFDNTELSVRGIIKKEDIDKSKNLIDRIIQSELDQGVVSNDRIMLVGYSQVVYQPLLLTYSHKYFLTSGGALVIYTFYMSKYRLAGCLTYGGILPMHNDFAKLLQPANVNQPLLMLQGTEDEVIPASEILPCYTPI